jgi:hypothetical protein
VTACRTPGRGIPRPAGGLAPALAAALLVACALPRAGPLAGVPSPVRLPSTALRSGYQRLLFRWEYRDTRISARGDGAARVAPPDSARLDFVVSGPLGGGGYALLFGDTLVAPGNGAKGGGVGGGGGGARRYLPATPLIWATLGRLAVPPVTDTIVHADGDTLRADIGPSADGTTWRVAFGPGGELTSLALVREGRVREAVERDVVGGRVHYQNPGGHRSLTLTQMRSEAVAGFDGNVWRP